MKNKTTCMEALGEARCVYRGMEVRRLEVE